MSVSESIPELDATLKEQVAESIAEVKLEREYIENLPEVHFIKDEDINDMEEKIRVSPMIKEDEKEKLVEQMKCLDGSQWDVNEKRCISCDKYGLVWDSEYKSCKIMLREDIEEEQRHKNIESDYDVIKLKVVEDNKGVIIGYLE